MDAHRNDEPIDDLAASLRRLLRRGLNPAALLRAPTDSLEPVAKALGVQEHDPAQTAVEVSSRLEKALDGFSPNKRATLRILLDLDRSEDLLMSRRRQASELVGLTPESFRKTREIQLIEELASNLLVDNPSSTPPLRPYPWSADTESFTRNLFAAIELDTSDIDIDLPEIRHKFDTFFVEPWVRTTGSEHGGNHLSGAALVESLHRAVIVGPPGAGKTTLVRHLARQMALTGHHVPFILSANSFAGSGLTLPKHLELLARVDYQLEPPPGYFDQAIAEGSCALFVDGLDEVPSLPGRRRLVRVIEQLAHRHPQLAIVVTTRASGYAEASLDSAAFTRAEILPFNSAQQAEFTSRWFTTHDLTEATSRDALSLLRRDDRPTSIAGTPLLLALLCQTVIDSGRVPADSKQLLAQYVRLLRTDLDRARGIHRDRELPPSVIDEVTEAIAQHLAQEGLSALPEHELLDVAARAITSDGLPLVLAREQAVDFMHFCRDRSWVITEVARESDGARLYGFTHRAVEELFRAPHALEPMATASLRARGHAGSVQTD